MGKWKKPAGRQHRWIKRHLINKFGARCILGNHHIQLMEDVTLDHIVPLSRGGSDSLENLQLACWSHNHAKASMMPDEWERFRASWS